MSERSLTILVMMKDASILIGTREKIIRAAVVLFVDQGVAGTTTREIASKAGVAEGSIYRYFPSKDQLAWEIFHNHHIYMANQLNESLKNNHNLKTKIDALVKCFLNLADEDWEMFCYYLTSQHSHMQKIKQDKYTPYKVVYKVIQQAREDNEIICMNVEIMTAMVMGAVHQIATNKIYKRIQGKLFQHHKLISQTIYQMVMTGEEEMS